MLNRTDRSIWHSAITSLVIQTFISHTHTASTFLSISLCSFLLAFRYHLTCIILSCICGVIHLPIPSIQHRYIGLTIGGSKKAVEEESDIRFI